MKAALEKAGLKRHLVIQPIGYKTPECLDDTMKATCQKGFTGLAEFPFGMLWKYWNFQANFEMV